MKAKTEIRIIKDHGQGVSTILSVISCELIKDVVRDCDFTKEGLFTVDTVNGAVSVPKSFFLKYEVRIIDLCL